MILKYALFTLTISIVPLTIIIRDSKTSSKIVDFINRNMHYGNIQSVSEILNTGTITSLFSLFRNGANKDQEQKEVIFSKDLLQSYSGKDGKPIYLAILGQVFDVSKATKYYGPGETYNVFTGRDGSRAFVTGDFTESGLTDDVLDLTFQELRSLNEWLKFYKKEYTYKGKLSGRYYDERGKPTGYYHKLQIRLEEAERDENEKSNDKLKYPPCNVEWTPEEGSRVWCSKRSGGVERDWVGVPRKLYEPGATTFRCACINTSDQSQVIVPETGKVRTRNLEEYEDCHPKSTSCYVLS